MGSVSGLGFWMIIQDPDSKILDSSGSERIRMLITVLRQNIIREATLMRLNDARLLKLPLIWWPFNESQLLMPSMSLNCSSLNEFSVTHPPMSLNDSPLPSPSYPPSIPSSVTWLLNKTTYLKKNKQTSFGLDCNVQKNLPKLRIEKMSQWEKQVFFCENEKNGVCLKLYISKIIIVPCQMTCVYIYAYKVWRSRFERGLKLKLLL